MGIGGSRSRPLGPVVKKQEVPGFLEARAYDPPLSQVRLRRGSCYIVWCAHGVRVRVRLERHLHVSDWPRPYNFSCTCDFLPHWQAPLSGKFDAGPQELRACVLTKTKGATGEVKPLMLDFCEE